MSGNHLQFCHTNSSNFLGEWRSTIQEESKLSVVAPIGRKIGGFMLIVSGLKNFYYLPYFHDMRCGYARIMEVIRMSYHRNPYKVDIFFFMSKNERSVRMVMYDKHAFNVHTCTFANGYRFMKIGNAFIKKKQQILKNFPGTYATVDMLVELVFNAYMLETPVYRDMIHLFELKF